MSEQLTPERLAELRGIADAATPGPWVADFGGTKGHIKAVLSGMSGTPTIAVYSDHVLEHIVPDDQREANGRYFETFDPPTVLAMLGEIERLQRIESAAKRVRDTHPYDHGRVVGLCDCSLCELNAALDGGKVGDAK